MIYMPRIFAVEADTVPTPVAAQPMYFGSYTPLVYREYDYLVDI